MLVGLKSHAAAPGTGPVSTQDVLTEVVLVQTSVVATPWGFAVPGLSVTDR